MLTPLYFGVKCFWPLQCILQSRQQAVMLSRFTSSSVLLVKNNYWDCLVSYMVAYHKIFSRYVKVDFMFYETMSLPDLEEQNRLRKALLCFASDFQVTDLVPSPLLSLFWSHRVILIHNISCFLHALLHADILCQIQFILSCRNWKETERLRWSISQVSAGLRWRLTMKNCVHGQ